MAFPSFLPQSLKDHVDDKNPHDADSVQDTHYTDGNDTFMTPLFTVGRWHGLTSEVSLSSNGDPYDTDGRTVSIIEGGGSAQSSSSGANTSLSSVFGGLSLDEAIRATRGPSVVRSLAPSAAQATITSLADEDMCQFDTASTQLFQPPALNRSKKDRRHGRKNHGTVENISASKSRREAGSYISRLKGSRDGTLGIPDNIVADKSDEQDDISVMTGQRSVRPSSQTDDDHSYVRRAMAAQLQFSDEEDSTVSSAPRESEANRKDRGLSSLFSLHNLSAIDEEREDEERSRDKRGVEGDARAEIDQSEMDSCYSYVSCSLSSQGVEVPLDMRPFSKAENWHDEECSVEDTEKKSRKLSDLFTCFGKRKKKIRQQMDRDDTYQMDSIPEVVEDRTLEADYKQDVAARVQRRQEKVTRKSNPNATDLEIDSAPPGFVDSCASSDTTSVARNTIPSILPQPAPAGSSHAHGLTGTTNSIPAVLPMPILGGKSQQRDGGGGDRDLAVPGPLPEQTESARLKKKGGSRNGSRSGRLKNTDVDPEVKKSCRDSSEKQRTPPLNSAEALPTDSIVPPSRLPTGSLKSILKTQETKATEKVSAGDNPEPSFWLGHLFHTESAKKERSRSVDFASTPNTSDKAIGQGPPDKIDNESVSTPLDQQGNQASAETANASRCTENHALLSTAPKVVAPKRREGKFLARLGLKSCRAQKGNDQLRNMVAKVKAEKLMSQPSKQSLLAGSTYEQAAFAKMWGRSSKAKFNNSEEEKQMLRALNEAVAQRLSQIETVENGVAPAKDEKNGDTMPSEEQRSSCCISATEFPCGV